MSEYFDISPVVSESSAIFPGDQIFRRNVQMAFPRDHLELSSVTTTVHVGAHADAPSHYQQGGIGISERNLHYYLGRCQVVRVQLSAGARLRPSDLGDLNVLAPRLLFATESFPNPNEWRSDFNSLSPELVEWVVQRKVITVGIDTPSIDPADSKELEAHKAVARYDLAVLEGLQLSHVPQGVYHLIALPLRWKDVEASPVRAVLLKSPHVLDE